VTEILFRWYRRKLYKKKERKKGTVPVRGRNGGRRKNLPGMCSGSCSERGVKERIGEKKRTFEGSQGHEKEGAR